MSEPAPNDPFATVCTVLAGVADGYDPKVEITLPDGQQHVMSSLRPDEATILLFLHELGLILDGGALALQHPMIRKTIVPIFEARDVLCDEERGERRFDEARERIARCQAADWRGLCENWITLVENGGEQGSGEEA